jgi:hypothetical protein
MYLREESAGRVAHVIPVTGKVETGRIEVWVQSGQKVSENPTSTNKVQQLWSQLHGRPQVGLQSETGPWQKCKTLPEKQPK